MNDNSVHFRLQKVDNWGSNIFEFVFVKNVKDPHQAF